MEVTVDRLLFYLKVAFQLKQFLLLTNKNIPIVLFLV